MALSPRQFLHSQTDTVRTYDHAEYVRSLLRKLWYVIQSVDQNNRISDAKNMLENHDSSDTYTTKKGLKAGSGPVMSANKIKSVILRTSKIVSRSVIRENGFKGRISSTFM
ncbi:hypothetical protein CHS0354_012617 [Potamilus streckersoni]|uniref:Uncharacterized protein n=1 Tax=Potamilus streckersoni TaxID=2493646 RepID=A0AAE0SYG5_9BIVA|nr:hypothetical protein CHS0354_012617 [Potamilus streckersoni]